MCFLICKSKLNIDWGPWYIHLNECITSSISNSTHMIDISNMIWKKSFKNDFYESSHLSIRHWLLPSIEMKCTYNTPEHGQQTARGNWHRTTHPFWTILSLLQCIKEYVSSFAFTGMVNSSGLHWHNVKIVVRWLLIYFIFRQRILQKTHP